MTQRLTGLATSALLIATLFIGTPAPAFAADPAVTYYVAQSGTPDGDGSSCTDPDFVGGDHTPIAAAVASATDGDTIYICAGTYAIETMINVVELLTLQGAGAGVTILDGGNSFDEFGTSNNDGNAILESDLAMTVSDITFQNAYNNSYNFGNGSAIIAPDVSLAVYNSSFVNNTAIYGSAIYNGDAGMVTIIDSTFTSNTATDSGGAVWTATAVVLDSTFTNNDAADNGGAIGTDNGNVTVTNSTFTGNTADDNGGAIYTFNTGVTATGSTFTDNYSDDDGGAIYAGNDATVTRSTFTGNTADEGGAIAGNDVTVTNSTFIGNTAFGSGLGGGAIVANTVAVTRSTFTDNDAIVFGGAISAATGNVGRSYLRKSSTATS